jgi:CBS domain-containing protein
MRCEPFARRGPRSPGYGFPALEFRNAPDGADEPWSDSRRDEVLVSRNVWLVPEQGGWSKEVEMRVHEVMTTNVHTVSPATSLKEAAELLVRQHISGVPVVDADGRVLGVVSEGDILFKERGAPKEKSFFASLLELSFLGWLLDVGLRDMHEKLEARTVGEAMTSPAVTIDPSRPLTAAANTMLEQSLKRLPVVDYAGRLVGIVTRADLVRAFVRSDEEIAREIREDVLRRSLWLTPDAVQVTVQRGEVRLVGEVETKADAEMVPTFVQRVPGVVSVLAKLNWPEENGRKDRTLPLHYAR